MRLKRVKPSGICIAAALAAVSFLLLSSPPAWAHKVYVFAWVEGDVVQCEAYFSKSRKVKNGKVVVTDPDGRVLMEGVTDDEGRFAFKPPQKSDLTVTVEGGMGHKASWTVKADELPGAAAAPAGETPPGKTVEDKAAAPSPETTAVSSEDLRKIVDEALEVRIGPLKDSVAALQHSVAELNRGGEGPGLVEIIGGIGWIVGIMGLTMYLRRPKQH